MSNTDRDYESSEPDEQSVQFLDIAPALEFSCWVVVGLAPLLRWINGAAVTRDQFVIQIAITSTALAGALSLRCYHYRAQRRAGRASPDQSHLE